MMGPRRRLRKDARRRRRGEYTLGLRAPGTSRWHCAPPPRRWRRCSRRSMGCWSLSGRRPSPSSRRSPRRPDAPPPHTCAWCAGSRAERGASRRSGCLRERLADPMRS
jgi:hypothetical protein